MVDVAHQNMRAQRDGPDQVNIMYSGCHLGCKQTAGVLAHPLSCSSDNSDTSSASASQPPPGPSASLLAQCCSNPYRCKGMAVGQKDAVAASDDSTVWWLIGKAIPCVLLCQRSRYISTGVGLPFPPHLEQNCHQRPQCRHQQRLLQVDALRQCRQVLLLARCRAHAQHPQPGQGTICLQAANMQQQRDEEEQEEDEEEKGEGDINSSRCLDDSCGNPSLCMAGTSLHTQSASSPWHVRTVRGAPAAQLSAGHQADLLVPPCRPPAAVVRWSC